MTPTSTAAENTLQGIRPLIDSFGRTHTSLRISVTDRCNLRCAYCMPATGVQFLPRAELLSYEEITRFVSVMATAGVNKLRLTGGEPLVRNDLPALVAQLKNVSGIREIALTTNAMLLGDQAMPLKQAGLDRINISLDSLDRERFKELTRRDGLEQTLAGIAAAQLAGFENIRLNAIAMRGVTEQEVVPLGRFAREQDLELRFIEYMPLDADGTWKSEAVLTGAEIRQQLEDAYGPLVEAARPDPSQPATDYVFADRGGSIGFINPVTQPFCGSCNRLRLTAEGQLRNCLFSTIEWDMRRLLREGASEAEILQEAQECVTAKKRGHGIGDPDFAPPVRTMHQIGG